VTRVRRSLACQRAQEILATVPTAVTNEGINPFIIAEAFGIVVRKAPLEDSLSGFLVRDQVGNTFIGLNDHDGLKRQRFTLAHELGHFFLHSQSETFLDNSVGQHRILARNEISGEGTDAREIEANLFAAELLMPANFIQKDLLAHQFIDLFGEDSSESVISELACKYNVSVRAMTIRLERLGCLTEI